MFQLSKKQGKRGHTICRLPVGASPRRNLTTVNGSTSDRAIVVDNDALAPCSQRITPSGECCMGECIDITTNGSPDTNPIFAIVLSSDTSRSSSHNEAASMHTLYTPLYGTHTFVRYTVGRTGTEVQTTCDINAGGSIIVCSTETGANMFTGTPAQSLFLSHYLPTSDSSKGYCPRQNGDNCPVMCALNEPIPPDLPNCVVVNIGTSLILVATRNIACGECVTIFYGKKYIRHWKHDPGHISRMYEHDTKMLTQILPQCNCIARDDDDLPQTYMTCTAMSKKRHKCGNVITWQGVEYSHIVQIDIENGYCVATTCISINQWLLSMPLNPVEKGKCTQYVYSTQQMKIISVHFGKGGAMHALQQKPERDENKVNAMWIADGGNFRLLSLTDLFEGGRIIVPVNMSQVREANARLHAINVKYQLPEKEKIVDCDCEHCTSDLTRPTKHRKKTLTSKEKR